MLAILGMVFGFVGPFLPELMKWLNAKTQNAHELALLALQMQGQDNMHRFHMEEMNAEADIQEATMLHEPQQSFGVQILDKIHDSGMSPWIMAPLIYGYALLDWVIGYVRPGVTWALVLFYMVTKYARYETLVAVTSADTAWYQNAAALWNSDDFALLMTTISFYFGGRTAKWAFGQKGVR